jgi:WD40 repeat protein
MLIKDYRLEEMRADWSKEKTMQPIRTWATLAALAFPVSGLSQTPAPNHRPAKARVDRYGDPLPEGASARLGTVRFRHAGAVRDVAFSNDGKWLAASSDDRNMVIIWERATGRKLREIPVANAVVPPTHLRFSSEGKRLYGSFWYGQDMALYSWALQAGADGKENPRLPGRARMLGYAPDGREMILLQNEAEIVRWHIQKGRQLARYEKPQGDVSTVAWLDERLLAPVFDGQSLQMWDAAHNKLLWSVKTTREANYPGLPRAFSPDGTLFAVEAPPRVISIHESASGKTIRRLKGDVEKIYYSLSISPDARTVAGSNWDGSLRLWDLESGRERAKIPTLQGFVTHVFFAHDSRVFATGGGNNAHAVLLWDTATGKPIDRFHGHTSPISSVSFSPDGKTVATSSSLRGDPIVRLWHPETGRLLQSLEVSNSGGVTAVAFSPDTASGLAACGWHWGGNNVWIWDTSAGRVRHALNGHQAGCTCAAFAPDGKRLVTGDAYYNQMGRYEGRLCLWDTVAGKRIAEIRGTRGAIQRVLFTPDARQVLAGADGIHFYAADTGQLTSEILLPKSRIWGLALSRDGRLLATADEGPARLWEMATRREIPLALPHRNASRVDLSPDGRTVAVSDPSGDVSLFHWPSGQTVARLPGDADTVRRVFFSPDGRRLVTTADLESSALVWDVGRFVSRPLPAVVGAAPKDLQHWWAELREEDPVAAYRSIWRFSATPEQSVRFLANSLRAVEAPPSAMVLRLIDELGSPEFQVRKRASQELEQLGEPVIGALRRAKKSEISLEQGRRIHHLLTTLDRPVPAREQLRAVRAVATLEQIASSEARDILARLAKGATGARLTREAHAALERLRRAEK